MLCLHRFSAHVFTCELLCMCVRACKCVPVRVCEPVQRTDGEGGEDSLFMRLSLLRRGSFQNAVPQAGRVCGRGIQQGSDGF